MGWRIMPSRLRSREFEKVKSENSKVKTMHEELTSFEVKEEEKPYNIRRRCYYFSNEIVLFVKNCAYNKVFSSLFDQLIKSATSIGAILLKGNREAQEKTGKTFLP